MKKQTKKKVKAWATLNLATKNIGWISIKRKSACVNHIRKNSRIFANNKVIPVEITYKL